MKRPSINHQKRYFSLLAVISILCILIYLGYRYWTPFGQTVIGDLKIPGAIETSFVDSNGQQKTDQIVTVAASKFPVTLKSKDIKSFHVLLKFKGNPQEIKLGVKSKETDKYVYYPLYQALVQQAANWTITPGYNQFLYQKNSTYKSITDFLANPVSAEKVSSYFMNKSMLSQSLPNAEGETLIETPLRGQHTFFIFLPSSNLKLIVSKQDLNITDGEDKLNILLTKEGKTLAEKEIPDDGIVTRTGVKKDVQTETIELTGLQPGIVRLDLGNEGSDSLITKIFVNQTKIVAKGLFIVDSRPSNVFTNSTKLSAVTWHPESLQTLIINDEYKFPIRQKNDKMSLEVLQPGEVKNHQLVKVTSLKNDLNYSGDGYFAFSQDQFFNPDIVSTSDLNSLTDLNNLDYIITSLEPAKTDGDWKTTEISIQPDDLHINGNTIYFSLEVPQIKQSNNQLEIEKFETTINYRGIFEKMLP